jgi:hypothetical protein
VTFTHVESDGRREAVDATPPAPLADAGANRAVVLGAELTTLLGSFSGVPDAAFDLPVRLAHHPTDATVYRTDLGNGRVGVWTYGPNTETAAFERDLGGFGHYEGGF